MEEKAAKNFYEKSPAAYSIQTADRNDFGELNDCVIAEVNPAFEKMFEIPAASAAGRRFSEVFSGERGFEISRQRDYASAVLHRRTGGTGGVTARNAWFRVKTFPVGGLFYGSVYEDATQEYLLDQDVRGFLRVASDVLCEMDADWKFTQLNEEFSRVLGYGKEDIEGLSYLTFLNIDDVPAGMENMKALKEKKFISGFVNQFHCKQGSFRQLAWSICLVGDRIYASAKEMPGNEAVKKPRRDRKDPLVRTDSVTGLYNREFFMLSAAAEIERADLYESKISMIIMEIEHLKTMNDTWGHPVGDIILAQSAQIISRTIRKSDAAAHLGMDEFVILLPQTTLIGATAAADKMRKMMAGNIRAATGKVSASFGIAERLPDESLETWYKRADAALFLAGQRGRNCIAGADANTNSPADMIMPPLHEWKKEWDSGSLDLDLQHRALLESGNDMISLSQEQASFEACMQKLEEFIGLLAEHHAFEEQLLFEIKYPDYRQHCKIHQKLLGKMLFLKDSYQQQQIKSTAFFAFLADDLAKGHFLEDDVKYYPYTRKG